ncbi:MAG: hypothetical protein ACXAC5_00990 [Promethearchaeota archaeon]
MSTDRMIQVLLGIITTIALGIAGFALMWVFEANAQMATIQKAMELQFADVEDSLITLADDTDDITRITKQLSKHWKLHNWAKDQLSELRHQHQLPPVSWPDLE